MVVRIGRIPKFALAPPYLTLGALRLPTRNRAEGRPMIAAKLAAIGHLGPITC